MKGQTFNVQLKRLRENNHYYGYNQLKKEQESVLGKFLTRHDAFEDFISVR